jgi:drug/metabolite transporter (DMT)-like permease
MWVVITLICALSLASCDALTKKALKGADEYVVGWLRLVFALPLIVPMLFFIEIPELDRTFYKAVAFAMPLEILAFVLYIKALRVSPMSLSLPFLAFTPVFLIGISFLILGERPSLSGVFGILLIAAGGYVLNLHHFRHGVLAPVRAVMRERGAVMMLAVAFIYGFTASLGKLGILHSSHMFFAVVYFSVLAVLYTPFALPGLRGASLKGSRLWMALLIGALMAVMIITHVVAVTMTKVVYMIAVKRTSFLFSVLYGCLFFREGHFRERSTGALLMFLGFVILVIVG